MAQALDDTRFGPSSALHVGGLARYVLNSLAVRAAADDGPAGPVRAGSLAALLAAVMDAETFDSGMVVAALRAESVSDIDIADHYIPEAARHLGRCWTNDDLSFARVTMATNRLQEVLGRLVQDPDPADAAQVAAPAILVCTFRGDQHILAWKLLTHQLRRQGLPVIPCLSATPAELTATMQRTPVSLVLISASQVSAVDAIIDLSARLRKGLEDPPAIVLGGSLTNRLDDPGRLTDICSITNDLSAALLFRRATGRGSRMIGNTENVRQRPNARTCPRN